MKELKGFQPLCVFDNNLYLYKKGKLFLYNESQGEIEELIDINNSFFEKIFEISRLTSRFFRTDIRSVLALNNDEILYSRKKSLYKVTISTKKVQKIFEVPLGFSDPLNICAPLDNSRYLALFGDYGNNSSREEVSIYGITKDLSIETIFSFEAGKVRHIHNIIPDKYNKGYYIFTGDNEKESGIYWIDLNFSNFKPVLLGTQNSRVVSGFVTEKGLLYATDSISEKNYIYLMTYNNEEVFLKVISPINGSCIYATEYSNGYVFSTTVESEEIINDKNKLLQMLSIKRGKGILSNEVHLIHVSKDFESKILTSFIKDRLPYKLFQYGMVRFSEGLEDKDTLILYPVGLKRVDGNTLFLKP